MENKTRLEILEKVKEIDSKWSLCTDSNCPHKEDCDIANHYISTFKKQLAELIDFLS